MGFNLARVKGLCFDIDGTISDTDDAWVAKLTRWFKPVGSLFPHRDPARLARWLVMVTESPMNSAYYWMDSLSLDDNFARAFEWLAKHRRHNPTPFTMMRGADILLEDVVSRYPLTVVTAREQKSSQAFLDQFDLQKHFLAVVSAHTCEHTKPFPEPVLFAAEKMGLPAESCVMIGDTTVDILAGKRAGAQTIGLLCGFGTESELRKAGADLILDDLVELKAVFDQQQPG